MTELDEAMTATEKLRRLLDEQGIEHKDFFDQTWWEDSDGAAYIAVETRPLDNNNSSTKLMLKRTATPEQAIAATLGSSNCSDNCTDSERTGTCRNVADDGFECSECKSWWIGPRDTKPPMLWGFKYCPNCGAKVVEPTTNDVCAEVDDG